MPRILIIEDESTMLSNIVEMLGYENYEAQGAVNGRTGIELAQEIIPDAIISDIMLPDIDGYEVLKAIRNNPQTAHIPFLFLSANRQPSDIAKGLRLGANLYMTKPFTNEELLSAVQNILNGKSE